MSMNVLLFCSIISIDVLVVELITTITSMSDFILSQFHKESRVSVILYSL